MKPLAYIPIFLVFLLAGCGFTPQGDVAREAFAAGVARGADQGLENMERAYCGIPTFAAVARRYGPSPEQARAYITICWPSRDAVEVLVGPGE